MSKPIKNSSQGKGDYHILEAQGVSSLYSKILSELEDNYGLKEGFLSGRKTVVLACVDPRFLKASKGKNSYLPAGFGVFQDLTKPHEHVGNGLDLEAARALSETAHLGLFRIALIHSCLGPQKLGEIATAILEGTRDFFSQRFSNHALVIPLMEKANEKAFPLYKKLGFKPRGIVSHLLEMDLRPHAKLAQEGGLPLQAVNKEVEVVFFDALRRWPQKNLSRCYARVFLGGESSGGLSMAQDMMSGLLGSDTFHPHTSFLVRRKRSKRVVGFLLSETTGNPNEINITVVGLDTKYRAQGLPVACFPLFAQRCVQRGRIQATQMTSRPNVVRLVEHYLGGATRDRLIWLIRAG